METKPRQRGALCVLAASVAALLCLAIAMPVLAQPVQPYTAFGSVTNGSVTAPGGVGVAAWCGVNVPPGAPGAQCDVNSTTTTSSLGNYYVQVACAGRTAGEQIVFKITANGNTYTANETGSFLCTSFAHINLTVNPTAVTLSSFTVKSRSAELLVQWQTASEANLAGFDLYRGTDPQDMTQGLAVKLNAALIPAQAATPAQGALYTYLDASVLPGVTYYYWLQDVTTSAVKHVHGPLVGTLLVVQIFFPVTVR